MGGNHDASDAASDIVVAFAFCGVAFVELEREEVGFLNAIFDELSIFGREVNVLPLVDEVFVECVIDMGRVLHGLVLSVEQSHLAFEAFDVFFFQFKRLSGGGKVGIEALVSVEGFDA